MKTIQWGILGAGRIAGIFSTALAALPDAGRLAVGSRDEKKAAAFAASYGFERSYGSYEKLLADPETDIIYVATPIRYHYEHIKACLLAGKNVLAEKPFTVNAAQAGELITLAKERGLFLMEAVWTKCQPSFLELKSWIAQGVLGELKTVDIQFYTAADTTHRLYNRKIAGGSLLDVGVYPVMYACALLGNEPERVISHAFIGEKHVDYTDSIVLEYQNGSYAHLSSGLGPEKMISLYIQGTKGRVLVKKEYFFQVTSLEALDYDNRVIRSFHQPFLCNGYEYEAMEAMECIRNKQIQSDKVPLSDTLAVMKILDTCRQQWGYQFEFE